VGAGVGVWLERLVLMTSGKILGVQEETPNKSKQRTDLSLPDTISLFLHFMSGVRSVSVWTEPQAVEWEKSKRKPNNSNCLAVFWPGCWGVHNFSRI
jgi:hypothetical protein